jgi:hypothetical protein
MIKLFQTVLLFQWPSDDKAKAYRIVSTPSVIGASHSGPKRSRSAFELLLPDSDQPPMKRSA